MQGDNFTDRLKALGLTTPGDIVKNWDFNPGFGGPIVRDRLWFYLSGRSQGANTFVPGQFYNKNANNLNAWTYVPDTAAAGDQQSQVGGLQRPRHVAGGRQAQVRVPVQHSEQLLLSVRHQQPRRARSGQRSAVPACSVRSRWIGPRRSPASSCSRRPRSTASSGGAPTHLTSAGNEVDPRMISVVDNGPGAFRPGMTYRSAGAVQQQLQHDVPLGVRGLVHHRRPRVQVRFQRRVGQFRRRTPTASVPYSYTFLTPVGAAPTPFSVTVRAVPYSQTASP